MEKMPLIKIEVGQPVNNKCAINVQVLDSVESDSLSATYRVIDAGYVALTPKKVTRRKRG